ncbi:MAG: hypothetical protein ACOYN4_03425 [Bacteroidales bacterium]
MIAIVFSSCVVLAQKTANQYPIYGFDPLLYNGVTYSFFPKPGTGGSQYLFKEFDEEGTITLRGITFAGVILNYDIFNQQLVLKYTNSSGAPSLIAISAAWLEEFDLNGCHFETIAKADTVKNIFQVLGIGHDKILFSFGKELLLDSFKSNSNHYFSEARKSMFFLSGEKIKGFKSDRGFIKCFDPTKYDEIKKYIRKNKIQVKKASDWQMNELINFCNTLN